MQAARHHQQEPESRERELFPVLANLVPYQQDQLGICEALEKPPQVKHAEGADLERIPNCCEAILGVNSIGMQLNHVLSSS